MRTAQVRAVTRLRSSRGRDHSRGVFGAVCIGVVVGAVGMTVNLDFRVERVGVAVHRVDLVHRKLEMLAARVVDEHIRGMNHG